MKKTIKITLGVIGGLLLLIAVLPFLFKDQIRQKLDSEIAKNINANVFYDADQFGLTLFRNFPNLTLSLGKFGLTGKAEAFKGDTLVSIDQFRVVVDLMSVIGGDKIKVKSIYLKQPYILTKYTKEGAFSWDITYPDSTASTDTAKSEPSKFQLAIEKWEIEDGTIIYDDPNMPVFARLNHLNHTGSGDITQDIYDVKTYTKSPDVLVSYGGITYLNKYLVEAKVDMNINMPKSEYKFLENEFTVNNFKMGLDGLIAMPDTNISMDLKFAAKQTDFKSLISLVPAVFLKGYDDLKAEGQIAFDGYAKGTYNAVTLPGFGMNLKINDASMQYPSLPTALTHILTDLSVDCKDGVIDHTVINLKKFHVDLGVNPIDARAFVNGLNPYDIDADVKAKVKLEDITKMFPIDSLTLKGLFALDVVAKGKYSDAQKLMPKVAANMNLTSGYVKYDGFPEALEDMNVAATVNSDGNMATSTALLQNFSLLLDKEPFSVKGKVVNFDDPNYDAFIKGIIDLTKMTKLFPLEGTTLSGRIVADIETKGIMSDVTGGKYGNTSTSGTMGITNLKYVSKDLPQGMALTAANFVFSPEKIDITKMQGFAGKSDIDVTGYFSNYMGYLFGTKDTTIHGKMIFKSGKFDVNEWMAADSTAPKQTAAQAQGPQQPETAFEVPKNIDFVLSSAIAQVLYTNMTLQNLTGDIIVKDGILRMNQINFNTLGGGILMNGAYNTQNIKKPTFDFDMDMKNIAVKEAYKTFNTVKTMAPIAENVEGNFSTVLKLKGDLGQDMSPVYSTLSGGGTLTLASAAIKGNKVLGNIASLTKMNVDPLTIKDVTIKYTIENGKLIVSPFDLNAGGTKMNIGGSNAFDGGIDYLVKMDMPAGAIGSLANNALASLTGKPSGGSNIKIDLKVTGTYDKPKVGIVGSSMTDQGNQAKDALVDKAKQQADQLKADAEAKANQMKADAEAKARAQADQIKADADAKAKAEADRIKAQVDAQKKAEQDKLKQDAQKKLKDVKLW